MTDTARIEMIPIDAISVVNPRARNSKLHQEITDNIGLIGLKRPITVRRLPAVRIQTSRLDRPSWIVMTWVRPLRRIRSSYRSTTQGETNYGLDC